MSDPKRLIVASENRTARLLLKSARESAPPGAERRALLAASGAVTAAAGLTAATTAGKAAGVAKVAGVFSMKWLCVLGVLGAGVLVGGGVAIRATRDWHAKTVGSDVSNRVATSPGMLLRGAERERHEGDVGAGARSSNVADPSAGAAPPDVPVTPSMPPTLPGVPSPSAPVAAPVAAAPRATSTPPLASAVAEPRASETPTAESMTAELATLDEARAALASGRTDATLASLAKYAARFPHGSLAQEAAVLRVEALAQTGDRAATRRAADALLAEYPGSPYAAQVRAALGGM